ncbi:hypothetical protein [Streptomyces sp. NBC_01262]|uniref:hypothetical protein n=1 Tax=Streptomyces sp. NBC_01262 TaxID=2903803 RepID=UPI002E3469EB|nr:hypothetical protein [Streptomyces sp. NBC_01262]
MTPYHLGELMGEWTCWIALALAAVWVGTGPWRTPRPKGRDTEQLTAVERRRSRLVGRSILVVAVLWILADIFIGVWVGLRQSA